jgi:hypothetical protein
MNAGRFKDLGTQTNDLELDGVEWAPPGADRPLDLAALEVGPLALLFHMLVVSVLCCDFVGCVPPHLLLCLYKFSRQKYGTKKGTLPDWNPGSSNFINLK